MTDATRTPQPVPGAGELLRQARVDLLAGRVPQAEAKLHRVIAANPHGPDAHRFLGRARARQGDPLGALGAFQRAIALGGKSAGLFNDLGIALGAIGKHQPAAAAYRLAIQMNPGTPGLYMNLANAQTAAGDAAGAASTWAECAQACPADPVARHMVAAQRGAAAPERANDDFVAATFDGFAATFDETLDRLGYRAPALVADALAAVCQVATPTLDILDAGCGTGLCAPLLRPFARRLDGVDLSAEMLARAKARGGYDQLHRGELVAFLRDRPADYDAIVAADVFSYFGALDAAFAAAAASLRPGGVLVATTELDGDSGTFSLTGTGRYRHGHNYVASVAAAAGFAARDIDRHVIRQENGQPVPGLVFSLRKSKGESK